MASIAQSLPAADNAIAWLWQWLRDELTPYPGRLSLVARMVTAATLVMIICMTFRIPYAFQGAIYALIVSRENRRATLQSAGTIFLFTGIGAAYILISMVFVVSLPLLHFLWVIG
jgi:multidrug resistance protein MdtO